jgi:hypothetical protein
MILITAHTQIFYMLHGLEVVNQRQEGNHFCPLFISYFERWHEANSILQMSTEPK